MERLRSLLGRRGLIGIAVLAVAIVGAGAIALAGGDDEPPAEPEITAGAAADPRDEPAPAPGNEKAKPDSKSAPEEVQAEEPADPAGAIAERFEEFRDCVREEGGNPIDLDDVGSSDQDSGIDGPGLAGYSAKEIAELRQAREACVEQLPADVRERAEALAGSPFRECVQAEQEAGSEIFDAAQACRDEIPESALEGPPPGSSPG